MNVLSKIHQVWRSFFFGKCSKFVLDFKIVEKISENNFCFWHNIIWIGFSKFSLLSRKYLRLAFNVFTKSPKILHITKRDNLNLNCLNSDHQVWLRWCGPDFNSVLSPLQCCLLKGTLKRDFSDIYLTTHFESVISEIDQVWGSHFFWKCLKFNVDFKNAKTSSQNNFCFWDNCIWIGSLKLSLLIIKRFSSAIDMLTNSLRTLHITKRDFFPTHLPPQWSINMVYVMSFRFQQCLVPLTMLLVEESSETGLFRHLFNHESVISEIYQLWGSSFFWQC